MTSLAAAGDQTAESAARRRDILVIAGAAAAGIALRIPFLDATSPDTFDAFLPWFAYAREHGLSSFRQPFTGYTPFFSYILVILASLGDRFEPLHLMKFASFVFEAGSAVVAGRIVMAATSSKHSAALAAAAVWLAPSVLCNGAVSGQADSFWTFFVLLSVCLFCISRPGPAALAFGAALAVKAQAIFLSPLLLAFVFLGKLDWKWLLTIPLMYAAFALPAVMLGMPVEGVFAVYQKQAATFHALSMNAANLWIFVPNTYYDIGSIVGILLTVAAALTFAVTFARSRESFSADRIVFGAALTLLLMPFLLPKMHDRYFYAFEVMAIVLAFIRPRLFPVAIAAQISSVCVYAVLLGFGDLFAMTLAVLVNSATVACMIYCAAAQWGGANAETPSIGLFVRVANIICLTCCLGWLAEDRLVGRDVANDRVQAAKPTI